MDSGLLMGLAEGIKSGTQSYQQARAYKKEEDRDAESAALRKRSLALDEAAKGVHFDDDTGSYQKTAESLERDRLSRLEGQNKETREAAEKGLIGTKDPTTGLISYKLDKSLLKPKDPKEFDPVAREMQYARLQEMKDRAEEKDLALEVPGVGKAMTATDAKDLKEATRSKSNFDSKISEMIALRKKYGGELMNREAVGRGKQLSKDLLLEYKNMAKLGVLSKSDEDIINAIIPEDPLEFSPAGLMGQDPIMHRLKKFQEDSDKDYQANLGLRLRPGTNKTMVAKEDPSQSDPDVKKYAQMHGLSYEQSKAIVDGRRGNSATAKR